MDDKKLREFMERTEKEARANIPEGFVEVPFTNAVREGDRNWNIHTKNWNKIRVNRSRQIADLWHFVIRPVQAQK